MSGGLLGRLAVHYRMVSEADVVQLANQLGTSNDLELGNAMVEAGLLTPGQFSQLVRAASEYEASRGQRRAAQDGNAGAASEGRQPARPPGAGALPPGPSLLEPAAAQESPRPVTESAPGSSRTGTGRQTTVIGGTVRGSGDAQRIEWLNRVLVRATQELASDIHIHAESPVRLRLRGELVSLNPTPLRGADASAVLTALCNDELLHTLEERGDVDFAYELPEVARFRVNVYREQHGLCGTFHRIPPHPPTLAQLGLPDQLAKLTHHRNGLVLIAGPAGAGKTSTMAALIEIMNISRSDHILSLEDPIEYRFTSKNAIVNQREVGLHTHNLTNALRSALREDPDVICVSELRNVETVELALTAAETGHLVIATLHTLGSARTINRLIGAYPSSQQSRVRAMLAESLRAVLSQKLVPRADQSDMVLAYELLLVNSATANLIREGRTYQLPSVIQTGRQQGMRSMDDALLELLRAGEITRETALANAENPSNFK